jgi:hypothetical protein
MVALSLAGWAEQPEKAVLIIEEPEYRTVCSDIRVFGRR